MQLERKLAHLLINRKFTLSIAESCTGGLLSHQLTNVPGSSTFFLLSIIAYDNRAKTALLGVPPSLIKKHGAVSQAVAQAMAHGAQGILKTDLSIAITGIAGPGGGCVEKPVGTVFISACFGLTTVTKLFHFKGSRLAIKKQAITQALKMLFDLAKSPGKV